MGVLIYYLRRYGTALPHEHLGPFLIFYRTNKDYVPGPVGPVMDISGAAKRKEGDLNFSFRPNSFI